MTHEEEQNMLAADIAEAISASLKDRWFKLRHYCHLGEVRCMLVKHIRTVVHVMDKVW